MRFFLIFLIITALSFLYVLYTGQVRFNDDWQTANRNSAHLAPDPKTTKEAVIQVYAARAFNWRGLFSVHTWIAVKSKNGDHYTVYQVVGWRTYYGLRPFMTTEDIPDRYWFNHKPKIIFDLRGKPAEKLIPKIRTAIQSYPYPEYDVWPGPNSNTLPAYIARQVPELELALPSNAIGKDYLPPFSFFARAPSGTGYQFSFLGLFGVLLAQKEGLEINILGLVYGVSPVQRVIKLPVVGEIGF